MVYIEKLSEIFKDIFCFEGELTMGTEPDDVENWDSLGHMNLVSTMEKKFNMTFEVDEIMEMDSVENIIRILGKKI